MNILLLTNAVKQPDDIDKGVNNLVFDFAKEWTRQGHNVVVVNNESRFPIVFYLLPRFIKDFFKKRGNFTIPSLASRKTLEWEDCGVRLVRIPIKKIWPHSSFRKTSYLKQEKRIVAVLEKYNFFPDFITGHWLEPQAVLINSLADRYGSKRSLVIHGEIDRRTITKYQHIFSRYDVLFFRSIVTKNKMIQEFETVVDRDKIATCISGTPSFYVNSPKNEKKWFLNNTIKIVFVGRLVKYKNVDSILKALERMSHSFNFLFHIIGDGPELKNLKKTVSSMKIDKNVCFLGAQNKNSIVEELCWADLFVMISDNEVFGMAYLEAMAEGCITIASKNGGIDGIIVDGENGFLCEQGNSESLYELFVKITSLKKETLDVLSRNAIETASKFDDSFAAKHYIESVFECEKRW